MSTDLVNKYLVENVSITSIPSFEILYDNLIYLYYKIQRNKRGNVVISLAIPENE